MRRFYLKIVDYPLVDTKKEPACVAHLPGLRLTILLIALHRPTAHQCADARKG